MLGDPAFGVLSIECLAGDGRRDAFERIQRRHSPIRAESQHGSGIKQGAEGIGAFRALGADPLFTPTPVIGSVIGLHGSDHFLPAETGNVAGAQMLGVFDAETAIARAILVSRLLVNFQDAEVCFIPNRMDHYLEATLVRGCNPFEHDAFGQHLLEEQTPGVRRIIIWFE